MDRDVKMTDKFKIGDKINYGFYENIEIIDKDDSHYVFRDKNANIKLVYISLVDKYGRLVKKENDE